MRLVQDDGRCFPNAFNVWQLLCEVTHIVRMPGIELKRCTLFLGSLQIIKEALGSQTNPDTKALAVLLVQRLLGVGLCNRNEVLIVRLLAFRFC